MGKRRINRRQFSFLRREVKHLSSRGLISGEQEEKILDHYDARPQLNFIRVVLTIGALLVGLGIISFIAGNWQEMGRLLKYGLIIAGFIGFNAASCRLSLSGNPKTSMSFLYVAVLIFGAGIFLTGQIFNLGGHFSWAFLLWAIGAFPAAVLFKDRLLYLLAIILLLFYVNGCLDADVLPFAALAALPLLYYFNAKAFGSPILTFFNNIAAINTLVVSMVHAEVVPTFVVLTVLAAGLGMAYAPVPGHQGVFRIEGHIVTGITGLMLTFTELWEEWEFVSLADAEVTLSVVFAIAFIFYLLYLVRKENFIALVFICAVIFRFYIDLTYDFLPKSMVFVTGGILLLALGYFIERTRRKTKGAFGDVD